MKTHKISEFEHSEQQRLWQTVCQSVGKTETAESESLLVANLPMGDTCIDALIISPRGILIASLMGLHGTVIPSETSLWKAGSRIVPGKGLSRNPYLYLLRQIQTLAKVMNEAIGHDVSQHINVCVVLNNDTELDNQLSPQTQSWFRFAKIDDFSADFLSRDATFSPHFDIAKRHVERLVSGHTSTVEIWNIPAQQAAESGAACYEQLELLMKEQASVRERYPALGEIFRRVAELGVSQCRLSFQGLFSKVDYIIKENGIPSNVAQLIHSARKSTQSFAGRPDDDLAISFRHDVKAVALLLSHLPGQSPIPPSLQILLPQEDHIKRWGTVDNRLVRCIVEEWDDNFIMAVEENNSSRIKVCYGQANIYLTRGGTQDWNYLRDILESGCVLNLVSVRMDEGVCYPELIIYEPDYLINITTVANCFETYDESPWVSLINKLKPHVSTKAILLGNLAGQYLDDTVHNRSTSLDDSYSAFLHDNAIAIASCPELAGEDDESNFKSSAALQLRNITQLIAHDLPGSIQGYETERVVLEPTFFSEVLGLQGRMDFYFEQPAGKSIIIEQKSGKGAFAPRNPDPEVPLVQEKHWVQLLLYRAIARYEFGQYDDQQQVFLLYSKYAKGLVAPGQSPDLLLRAFKLRNMLAWSEMKQADEGFRILEKLTPEILNRKQSHGSLWNGWTRPELDNVLRPIKEASEVEREYFFRYLQFLQKEVLMSKLGSHHHADSGFAGHWLDSLTAKQAAGCIFDQLTLVDYHQTNGAVDRVRLRMDEAQSVDSTVFRPGDIVVLYPYLVGQEPSACLQMVTRGALSHIDADSIEITLTFPQTNQRVFERPADYRWAVEPDMFESSTSRLFSALHSMLLAPKHRRDLLLGQREPRTDESLTLKGGYGSFNTLMTREKQARDLFLIIGPPGTGKTSFGMLNVLKEELLDNANVLILSYTNRAVDEVCCKLVEEGIDFVRIGSELSCDKRFHDHLLRHRVEHMSKASEVRQMIHQTRVFCATTTAMNSHAELFHIKNFDLAIVDEASQILEPHLVGLFSARHENDTAIKKWVLIGDHKQLPAVVRQSAEDSAVTNTVLQDIHLTNCRQSLFERLLRQFKQGDSYDPRFVYMLNRQGRMHSEIAEFASRAFYSGQLDVVPLEHQIRPCTPHSGNGIVKLVTSHRITFVASEKPTAGPIKSNAIEAKMIATTVNAIWELTADTFDPDMTVGVIVPYRNQVAAIRREIDHLGIAELREISVDTVERYQGSQRDYIIYGFTATEGYELDFLTNNCFLEDGRVIDRKLNVAMTRAREHLMLVGCPAVIGHNALFSELMAYIQQRGAFVQVPADDYCQGNFDICSAQ